MLNDNGPKHVSFKCEALRHGDNSVAKSTKYLQDYTDRTAREDVVCRTGQ